jgi:hypothetical protein
VKARTRLSCEKKLLRRIFGFVRGEVTRRLRELHNKDVSLVFLTKDYEVPRIKENKMTRTCRHVALLDVIKACSALAEKPKMCLFKKQDAIMWTEFI